MTVIINVLKAFVFPLTFGKECNSCVPRMASLVGRHCVVGTMAPGHRNLSMSLGSEVHQFLVHPLYSEITHHILKREPQRQSA